MENIEETLNKSYKKYIITKDSCCNIELEKTFIKKTPSQNPGSVKLTESNHKQILVIGQSGHGKTTFINSMINILCGRTPNNLLYISQVGKNKQNIFYDEDDDGGITERKSLGGGLTTVCKKYKILDRLTIIDTPGFADKAGLDKDLESIGIILKKANDCRYLNAIILVINGQHPRLDIATQHSLNILKEIIPLDFEEKLLVVYTRTKNAGNLDFNPEWINIKPLKEFYIDLKLMGAKHNNNDNKKNQKKIQKQWGHIEDVINLIDNQIKIMDSLNVFEFERLSKLHNDSKSIYSKIKIDLLTLNNEKKRLEKLKIEFKDNLKLVEEVEINVCELENTDYHNTCCMICSTLCHEHCQLLFMKDPGDSGFINCYCIYNNRSESDSCYICKCNHKQHYHAMSKPVNRVRRTRVIREDISNNDNAPTLTIEMIDKQKTEIFNLETYISNLDYRISSCRSSLIDTAEFIKRTCPRFNIAKHVWYEMESIRLILNSGLLKQEDMDEKADWMHFLEQLYKDLKQIFDR